MSKFKSLTAGLDVLSTVAIIATRVLLSWKLLQPSGERPSRLVESVTGEQIVVTDGPKVLGQGRVAIVEFSDFECPVCRRFALNTLPALKERFIDTGRVRYVPRHFPLEEIHTRALQAGEAAECAGRQGKYWAMHERLFADKPAVTLTDYPGHAEAIGLDSTSFAQCLGGQTLDTVNADLAEGRRLGVTGTPSFFLGIVKDNGAIELVTRINGAAGVDTFVKEIDSLSATLQASLPVR